MQKFKMAIAFVLLFSCYIGRSQNVAITNTGTPPDISAALDVQSISKGFLVPRMTLAQRIAISTPATGLLVYQTDGTAGFFYNQGTSGLPNWITLGAQGPTGPAFTKTFQLVNSGTSSWLIDNSSDYVSGSNENPTLTLTRGMTYRFNVTVSGHPFRIASSSFGPAFTVGITNNDVQSNVLTFKVPMDAPSQLFYYCTFHSSMNGIINIQ